MGESEGSVFNRSGINEAYRPLPFFYFIFMSVWSFSALYWTINTYRNRHFQVNKLQWFLTSVPTIKALQLTLSFFFWFSCLNLEFCSLWISFGVYVAGVLFQTASFVSFLLIAHGYCILCERLSAPECRTTATLGAAFYFSLIGYKASLPFFSVLLVLSYFASFCVIFHHISKNMLVLREQLTFIEDDDINLMHDAVYTKYVMFKKFQGVMQIIALAEMVTYISMDGSTESYWLRLLVREWAQFCIFLYIGWIFRSRDLAPRFSMMPRTKFKSIMPPIFSIEMDAATFKSNNGRGWHIGVPTFSSHGEKSNDPVLVIIQHPHSYKVRSSTDTSTRSSLV